jgi:hypothetical protein
MSSSNETPRLKKQTNGKRCIYINKVRTKCAHMRKLACQYASLFGVAIVAYTPKMK